MAAQSQAKRNMYLAHICERMGIDDNDAIKTGRGRAELLAHRALTFLSKKAAAQRKQTRERTRGENRGLLEVVDEMKDTLCTLFQGKEVCVNVDARRAEVKLRTSLLAQLRGAELKVFETRM